MYIGWREIRDAKGRFGLISGVIALLAFMVVMLSALTAGLSDQSASAVRSLPGAGVVVQSGADGGAATLTDSRLDEAAVAKVTAKDPSATVLGVANTRISSQGRAASVAAFGFSDVTSVTVDEETAAKLGLRAGSEATVGTSTVRIDEVGDAGMYAHQPVLRMPYDVWAKTTGRDVASAVIAGSEVSVAGTAWTGHKDMTSLVPGYASEHSSLLMIQGLLLIISAVVVGGFFAVWTGQRVQALAVVRALGGSRKYLLRDGLGQAAVVLVAGLVAGTVLGLLGVWAASGTVPVMLDLGTTSLLLAAMAALGLIGAGLALKPLVTVDPLTALNR